MKFILALLLIGFVSAKPSFDFSELDDEEFIRNLVQKLGKKEHPRHPTRPTRPTQPATHPTHPTRPANEAVSQKEDILSQYLTVLKKIKERMGPNAQREEKYKKAETELVDKLLVLQRAVVGTAGTFFKFVKLMAEDYKNLTEKVKKAADHDEIPTAVYEVGLFYLIFQQRLVSIVEQGDSRGLFEVDENDRKEIHETLSEIEKIDHYSDKEIGTFFKKNFNQLFVSDGFKDELFVKLGVETGKQFQKTIHLMENMFKMNMYGFENMTEKVVRFYGEKNLKGSIQAAGSSVLSFVRRYIKIEDALHQIYSPKQAHHSTNNPITHHHGQQAHHSTNNPITHHHGQQTHHSTNNPITHHHGQQAHHSTNNPITHHHGQQTLRSANNPIYPDNVAEDEPLDEDSNDLIPEFDDEWN